MIFPNQTIIEQLYLCFFIIWLLLYFIGIALKRGRGYKLLRAEQTFRLFIILNTVISRRNNQWYIVSQLLLEQTIWQAWPLVFLPTKLLVLLKIIFFISLKLTKITSYFWGMWPWSRWSCDIQFHKYAVHINGDFWW